MKRGKALMFTDSSSSRRSSERIRTIISGPNKLDKTYESDRSSSKNKDKRMVS